MLLKNLRYIMSLALALLAGCAIENDIPYPEVNGLITDIAVEGQRAAEGATDAKAVIDNAARTVTLYVNDSVDVSELRVTRLALSPTDAALLVDSSLCDNPERFPFGHFASLDSLPASANTRLDFSRPVDLTLRTYQDYTWRVTVEQIIQRDIDVEGMTRYVLDADTRTVIIYVEEETDLSDLRVRTLDLGGAFGEVTPDPTTMRDFTSSRTFYARLSWEETWSDWKVFVYPDTGGGSGASGDVFPMTSRAIINGSVTSGKTPVVEYKESNASSWQTVDEKNMEVKGGKFTATLTGLTGSTTYNYRVSVDGVPGAEQSFTTVAAAELPNGGFEDWSEGYTQSGNAFQVPNKAGEAFWGTGNEGSMTMESIGNVTYPTSESVSGQAALLESKWAILKLAAGNLFTGEFGFDPDHTLDGQLTFGRPFTSFPTALSLYYKYTSATIDQIGQNVGSLASLKGQPDMCHIYIALTDKQYTIKNCSGNNGNYRQLFDKYDRGIIAYGEFISDESTSSFQQIEIPIEYRANRTPKYIIIVASSSRYGDYYIGGVGSKLWIDEMELVYE